LTSATQETWFVVIIYLKGIADLNRAGKRRGLMVYAAIGFW
jgi:hypothetical protein